MAKPCTIVICDDQAAFREIVSVVLQLDPNLELAGEAADGAEAIRVVGEVRPDVLLLDVAMPVMDGLEALPHLRLASPETTIVMLTAMASPAVRRRAADAGAAHFIEKGTDIEALLERVREICGGG